MSCDDIADGFEKCVRSFDSENVYQQQIHCNLQFVSRILKAASVFRGFRIGWIGSCQVVEKNIVISAARPPFPPQLRHNRANALPLRRVPSDSTRVRPPRRSLQGP